MLVLLWWTCAFAKPNRLIARRNVDRFNFCFVKIASSRHHLNFFFSSRFTFLNRNPDLICYISCQIYLSDRTSLLTTSWPREHVSLNARNCRFRRRRLVPRTDETEIWRNFFLATEESPKQKEEIAKAMKLYNSIWDINKRGKSRGK